MIEVETRILSRLEAIEVERSVHILMAVEAGSRAWGFASSDSDYDVRFLFIRPLRDMVRVDPLRDVIELPLEGDLDINGWEIVKALALFRKSNPPLLEWLRSPIIYSETGPLAARLRELSLTQTSLRRMAYHYLSMARRNYLGHIQGRSEVTLKKYLYVLRPLACIRWLTAHGTPPPTAIRDTLSGVELPQEVRHRLDELIDQKRAGLERGTGSPDRMLDTYIENDMQSATAQLPGLADPEMDPELLNALLWESVGISR